MKLPKGFIYGGATAAYQAEGESKTHGKGKVAWDDYLQEQGRFCADPASDFYHQYPKDLALCKMFGINGIRISIAWSRIFPDGEGGINDEGVAYYHRVFQACKQMGVEPFVTLHHFDTPDVLHKQGDFLNQHTIDCYEAYAKFCFREYAQEVTYWITFNELWPVAANQYLTGTFPPCITFSYGKVIQSMYNMMQAHARAVICYKQAGYQGKIGIVHSLETKYAYDEMSEEDHHAAKLEDALSNRFLLDMTFEGTCTIETKTLIQEILDANHATYTYTQEEIALLKQASKMIDFLGINYYQSFFVRAYNGENSIHHNGTGDKGTSLFRLRGIGEHMMKEDIERTDWDWQIYPQGLYDMIMRIVHEYPAYKELYITENGMGYKDEFQEGMIIDTLRIDYIRKHIEAVAKAISEGACVKGYFVWSLMDVYSWSNGYNKRYGLFYVDYENQKRYAKESAYWFKRLAETGEID